MNKRKLTRTLIVIIVLVSAISWLIYYRSFSAVKVTFSNVSKVEAFSQNDNEPNAVVTKAGTSLRLSKGLYTFQGYGVTGFKNVVKIVSVAGKSQTVDFKPGYSQSRLDLMLTDEIPFINAAVAAAFPNITQYSVQHGSLYHNGDWYGATLKYNGSDLFNADNLRVVLNKSGGTWKVATNHPDINLSVLVYPQIPRDVIDSVNKL